MHKTNVKESSSSPIGDVFGFYGEAWNTLKPKGGGSSKSERTCDEGSDGSH